MSMSHVGASLTIATLPRLEAAPSFVTISPGLPNSPLHANHFYSRVERPRAFCTRTAHSDPSKARTQTSRVQHANTRPPRLTQQMFTV